MGRVSGVVMWRVLFQQSHDQGIGLSMTSLLVIDRARTRRWRTQREESGEWWGGGVDLTLLHNASCHYCMTS